MGQRDGALLGGDREKVDAAPDHRLTDSDVQVEIVVQGQIVPVDGRVVHEVDAEGRAFTHHGRGQSAARELALDPLLRQSAQALQLTVGLAFLREQEVDGRQRRGHGDRMPAVGAGDHHPPTGILVGTQVHVLAPAAHGRERVATGEGLGKIDQVRLDAAKLAVGTDAVAEAGLDLVEHEQEAVFVGEIPQSLEITRSRLHQADVLQDRLGDQCGNRVLFADVTHRLEIIEVYVVHQFTVDLRDPGAQCRVRVLARRHPRTDHLNGREHIARHVVVRAVEATLHNDDVVPAGRGAGDSQGGHARFRTGGAQVDLVDGLHVGAQQLGEPALLLVGAAAVEADPTGEDLSHGLGDDRMVVPKDVGGKSGVVVEVAVTLQVPHPGSPGAGEIDRGCHFARAGNDAAGNVPLVVPGQFRRVHVGLEDIEGDLLALRLPSPVSHGRIKDTAANPAVPPPPRHRAATPG